VTTRVESQESMKDKGRLAAGEVNSKIPTDFSAGKIKTMFPIRARILRNSEGNL